MRRSTPIPDTDLNVPLWIEPNWPAPPWIRAGTTTRLGGTSTPPYAGLNLADHVGDREEYVRINRRQLLEHLALPAEPVWLRQVHGNLVIDPIAPVHHPEADGSCSSNPAVVCAVLTADCLPLLLCDRQGTRVAALHCGWRGLCQGIIESGLDAMGRPPAEILAWLGPAIGPSAYEIGEEVHAAFMAHEADLVEVFTPAKQGHWRLDLYRAARILLEKQGVAAIYGGEHCTYSEARLFYSHRRSGTTGRMASLIWIAK